MKTSQINSPHLLHPSLGVAQVIRVVSIPRYPARPGARLRWSTPRSCPSGEGLGRGDVSSLLTCLPSEPCPQPQQGHLRQPHVPISSWRSRVPPPLRASAPPGGAPGLGPPLLWATQLGCGCSHHSTPAPSRSMCPSTSTNVGRAQQRLPQKRGCNASHHPNPGPRTTVSSGQLLPGQGQAGRRRAEMVSATSQRCCCPHISPG